MRHRLPISLGRLFTALVALVVATTPAAAQNEDRPEPPRTSWGAPDLQGVWDYRTATPMERPRNYGDREFLTDEEAAAYEQQFSQRLDDSRRSPGTVADVERAYNEFWYDFGSNLTEDKTHVVDRGSAERANPTTDGGGPIARDRAEREPTAVKLALSVKLMVSMTSVSPSQ